MRSWLLNAAFALILPGVGIMTRLLGFGARDARSLSR